MKSNSISTCLLYTSNEISYIVGDDNDWINNRIQKTKADGKITVEKTAKGYPIIYFTEHDVKINPSNPMKDSYRIVEILEESEDTWGTVSYTHLSQSILWIERSIKRLSFGMNVL